MIKRILTFVLFIPFMTSADIQIYPVRLDLKMSAPIGAFTLINNNPNTSEPGISFNAVLVSWKQVNGQNIYTKNPVHIFLIPPIFTVPSNSRQIVRISLINLSNNLIEKDYRVLFKQFTPELLNTRINHSETSINFAIRTDISVPVFIPPLASKKIAVNFSASLDNTPNTLLFKITNLGNTHIHLLDAKLSNSNGLIGESKKIMYILPGSTMSEKIQIIKPILSGEIATAQLKTDDSDYPKLTGNIVFHKEIN